MLTYLASATLLVGLVTATPQPPQWESSYGKALAATREGDHPLLVVIDKPGTEGSQIDPKLLSQDTIEGDAYKAVEPYNLCHVDATTEYGQKVADVFHAKTFPYVAIIDKTGSVVLFRKAGNMDATEWDRVLASHKSGERTASTAVSHVSYKPVASEGTVIENTSGSYSSKSYCPNCQRKSF